MCLLSYNFNIFSILPHKIYNSTLLLIFTDILPEDVVYQERLFGYENQNSYVQHWSQAVLLSGTYSQHMPDPPLHS